MAPTAISAKPAQKGTEKLGTEPTAKPAADKPAEKSATTSAFDEQTVADFYKDKTIRIIVAASPGGGFDTYSRLIARYIGEYIPGHPNVIVENMPGAGYLIATNYVYNRAPKDGIVIGNFGAGVAMQQALGGEGVEFDAAKFEYLGLPTTDTPLCVATKASGLKSLAETIGPNGQEFIVGGAGPGNPLEYEPRVLRDALGANIKIVSGYGGSSNIRLAMDQGEVEGICGWGWESVQATALSSVQSGDYVVISQHVERRHKDLPDVPTMFELAKTEEARKLLRFGILLPGVPLRQYALPPGVPADRIQALRVAFANTVADKKLLVDAETAKLNIDPVSGEEAQQAMQELLSMPADIKAKLKDVWK